MMKVQLKDFNDSTFYFFTLQNKKLYPHFSYLDPPCFLLFNRQRELI